jgi:hypothetical protein
VGASNALVLVKNVEGIFPLKNIGKRFCGGL